MIVKLEGGGFGSLIKVLVVFLGFGFVESEVVLFREFFCGMRVGVGVVFLFG